MSDEDYRWCSTFLQAGVREIAKQDWQGFLNYCESLILNAKPGFTWKCPEDKKQFETIQNIAGHMLAIQKLADVQEKPFDISKKTRH